MLFLVGTAITVYLGGVFLPLCVVAVFVLCILLCTVRFFKQAVRYSTAFMLLPILGALYVLFFRNVFVMPFSVFHGKTDTVTGTVVSVSQTGCDISVTSSTGSIPNGTLIRVYSDMHPIIGDTLTFKGKLKYAGENNGLISSDIKLFSSPLSVTAVSGSGIINGFRHSTYSALDSLDGKYSEFIKAIVFNDKSEIGRERYAVYRNAGAAAYFSVSGLHISFLVMALFNVLSYFRVNKYLRGTLSVFAAVLYGCLVGFTPSVFRAVVMILFIIISQMLTAESDSVTSLFFALGLLLIQNPFSVASVGLQLSFLATLGTLYVGKLFSRFSSKNAFVSLLFGLVAIPLLTSLACFVFTLPITCFAFDAVSLISPISNIILSVIFAPLILSAFAATLFAQCTPIFGMIKYPVIFLIDAFDAVCDFFGTNIKLLLPANNGFAAAAAIIGALTVVTILITARRIHAVAFAVSSVIIFATVLTGAFVIKRSSYTACNAAYKQGFNGYSVIAVCDGVKIYIDYGAGFDDSFVYSRGITEIDMYVAAEITDDTLPDLEYAVNCFGVKKLMCLSEIPYQYGEPLDEFSENHGVDIISDTVYTAGTPYKGVVIESGIVSLYVQNDVFMISQSGDIYPNTHIIGAVFGNSVNYLSNDKLKLIDRIYCDDSIIIDSEAKRSIEFLEYGSTVTAAVINGDRIEVKTDEP